jgi:hypothetical protein
MTGAVFSAQVGVLPELRVMPAAFFRLGWCSFSISSNTSCLCSVFALTLRAVDGLPTRIL